MILWFFVAAFTSAAFLAAHNERLTGVATLACLAAFCVALTPGSDPELLNWAALLAPLGALVYYEHRINRRKEVL